MSIESMWGPLIVFGTIFGCAMLMRSLRLIKEFWLSRDEDRELTRTTWGKYFNSLPLVDVAAIASSILPNPSHYQIKGELCDELANKITSYMDGASFFTHVGLIQLIIAAEAIGVDVTSCEDQDDIIYSLREFIDLISLDFMSGLSDEESVVKNSIHRRCSTSGSDVSLTSTYVTDREVSSKRSTVGSGSMQKPQSPWSPAPIKVDDERDNETATELDSTVKQTPTHSPNSGNSQVPSLTSPQGGSLTERIERELQKSSSSCSDRERPSASNSRTETESEIDGAVR